MSLPGRRSRNVVRNTISNSIGKAVTVVTGFLLTPYILHSVGETAFGVWVLAGVVVSYGSLLDFGMGSAVIKYVAESRATGDADAARQLLATATRLYAGLAGVALIIGYSLAFNVHRVIDLGAGQERSAALVLGLATTTFAINLAATPATATLRGLQRYDITNLITVVSVVTSALLTVLVLSHGGGVVAMMAVTVPVSILGQGVAITVLRGLDRDYAMRWSLAARSSARRLTTFGFTISMGQMALLLQKRTGELIIVSMLTVSAV
ncbi:MAG: oligosaccharide flippase family protein, partial [Propionibacteriales bacterium]|nr:oligosaccharide flippase family protein [Propionibacteriales bacterium]